MLRGMTKVEAELLNDKTLEKQDALRRSLAKKIKKEPRDILIEFARRPINNGHDVRFTVSVTVSPDEKHPRGFSAEIEFDVMLAALRTAGDRREALTDVFIHHVKSLVNFISVEYSPAINCPRLKCFGKAKRISPAIPRQFLCGRCGHYTIECPVCRDVSTFRIAGTHHCEECGCELIAGDRDDRRDERG